MTNRQARLWYLFRNKFRRKAGMGEPLIFLLGSEEELRRVTVWMCHAYPEAFADAQKIVFWYMAPFEDWQQPKARFSVHGGKEAAQAYLQKWGAYILDQNQFTGTQWTKIPREFVHLSWRETLPLNGLTLLGFREEPAAFMVRVHPPSAHEQAEALLCLYEWLDGKATDAEKSELLDCLPLMFPSLSDAGAARSQRSTVSPQVDARVR